jgi:lipoyl(octanoyl) transferase
MPETWYLLESGAGPSAHNMAWDETLLEVVAKLGHPVLRFYGWIEPAATFGYSQRFADVASWTALRPLIRRPTGGGLVPHDADWTYSLLFPPGHWWYQSRAPESYQRVHEWIRIALTKLKMEVRLASQCQMEGLGQCFVGAEQFDVLCNDRKIAGAAQRRNRLGLLIQGSVQASSTTFTRQAWEMAMRESAPGREDVAWQELKPNQVLAKRADQLASEKYGLDEYNRRR